MNEAMNEAMKVIIGLLLIIIGVVLGLYVGGYLMFIGGIIQLIQSITPVVIASGIAFGVVKIMLASFVGGMIFFFCVSIGQVFLK